MLVSLVRFFGSEKANGCSYTDKQRRQLVRWFWRSCFARRYSSGVNSAHETDLNSMERLRDNENFDISSFKCDIPTGFFTDNVFNINSVNSRTFIAMLANNNPKSFISGASVDLSQTLKIASSKEFHHIFPDKYLQKLSLERKDIYQLANFCFLNNADNQKIKDRSPSEYKQFLNPDSIPDVLKSAICPSDTFELDYGEFILKRKAMLMDFANRLINYGNDF